MPPSKPSETSSPLHPETKVSPSPQPSSSTQVQVHLVKHVGQVIPYIPGAPLTQEQLDIMQQQQQQQQQQPPPYQANQNQQGMQQFQPVVMQPMQMQMQQQQQQQQPQLLNLGNMQVGADGPEIPPDQLHIFPDPIHQHMPKLLVRVEMGAGRNRWNAKEDTMSDYWFYLCNNHEVLAMFFCHPGNVTDKPTRIILLLFGFCFGLMFEVGISSLMKSNTEELVVGALLGLFQFVLFFFLEHFFTCSFIRGKMDDNELKRQNEGHELKKDQKFVRDSGFILLRMGGGCIGFCFYLPGAIGCFFGAVAIMAKQRDVSFSESYGITTSIWLWGYTTGAMYSVMICTAYFFYERSKEPEYKHPQVRKQVAQP